MAPLRSRFTLSVLVLLAVAIGTTAVVGVPAYDVTTDETIDVPDRTVEVGGDTVEITSIGRAEPGGAIVAETTAPDDSDYTLYLYNSDGQREDFSRMSGSDSTTLSADLAGTYLLALRADRSYEAVQPVVVPGYEASQSVPSSVEPGETIEVTIELEPYDDAPAIDAVEVVLVDDGAEERIEAVEDGDTYVAEFTAPAEEEDYRIYTTVLGTEEIAHIDEPVILEVSDASVLEVSERDEDDGGEDTDGGDDQATEQSPTLTETATPSATPTPTEAATSDEVTPTEVTQTETPTPTDDGPLTPSEETPPTPTPEEQIGFDVGPLLVAILGAVVLVYRLRRSNFDSDEEV